MRSVPCFLAVVLLARSPAPAHAGDAGQQLLYLATWPHQIVIFDATQEKVVDTIDLKTDVPDFLILSPDKKKLYLNTVKDNSIVTIDLATRKPAYSQSEIGQSQCPSYGAYARPNRQISLRPRHGHCQAARSL